jgi:hypothetical protein
VVFSRSAGVGEGLPSAGDIRFPPVKFDCPDTPSPIPNSSRHPVHCWNRNHSSDFLAKSSKKVNIEAMLSNNYNHFPEQKSQKPFHSIPQSVSHNKSPKVFASPRRRRSESRVNPSQKASVWLIFKERFPIVYEEGSDQQEASPES